MVLVRDIYWYCAIYNVHLTARHISGTDNLIADKLSHIAFNGDMGVINLPYVAATSRGIPVGMEEVDRKLGLIIQSAWVETTLKTRNSQWARFINFCYNNTVLCRQK